MGVGIFTMVSMYLLNSYFYGLVIGKLPFVPFGMVTSMSHRGIDGEDWQEVSLIFIFILS